MRRDYWLKLVGITVILSISLMLGGCSSSSDSDIKGQPPAEEAEEQALTFNYATQFAATNFMSEIDIEFFDKIYQDTGGKIKVEPFWGGTLIDSLQWYQEVVRGAADIAHIQGGTNMERFPLNAAASYFFLWAKDNDQIKKLTMELYNTTPELQAEYKDIKPLIWITNGQLWIHTAKRPVRTADDIKGMIIRVIDDPSFALVKELGGNPVRMTVAEAYSGLQKGVIDGIISGVDALTSFNFGEVTKYSTALPYRGAYLAIKVMNIDSWNKLTPETQKIFESNCEWWENEFYKRRNEIDQDTFDYMRDNNHEIITLDEAENEKIVSVLNKIAEEMAQDAGAMEIYQKAVQLMEDSR